MRSKTILAVVISAAIVAGSTVTAVALARSSAATTAARTLTFVGRPEPGNLSIEQVAKGSPESLGNIVAFTSELLDGGKRAGEVHLASVGVDRYKHLSQATGTVTLPNGTIAFVGLVSQLNNSTLAVVGGTGAYAAAHGTLTVATNGQSNTVTIKLG